VVAHESGHVPIAELSGRIAAEPGNVQLLLLRAELRRIDGDHAGARADLDRAESLAPGRPDLPIARAALALDRGEAGAARAWLDQALAALPGEPEALRLRARALAALGEARAAIQDLDALIAGSRAPHPDLFVDRARLWLGLDEPDRALAGLDEARARLGRTASLEPFALELAQASGRAGPPRPPPAAERARRLAVPTAAAASTLVLARNSAWRYNATGTDLGTAWRASAYDDSSWPSGPGVLGYGDPFIATTVPFGPNPNSKYPTTYFRTTFEVSVPPATLQSMVMTANFDDGFVVYVNGVEAARRSLPAGTIAYGTFASLHEAGAYETVDLGAALPALVVGTNVLAVEVHQASSTSSDLAWDADLTVADQPIVTRGPYLQAGTPDAITIRWRTNSASASWVRFGTSPGELSASASSGTPATEHEVRLTGLSPATRYWYSVGTAAGPIAGDATHTFQTAPVAGGPSNVRLWALGDSGLPGATAQAVRDAYTAWAGGRATDFWLMLGDNAYATGTDAEYQAAVFDQYPVMLRQSVLWPTRGNHDFVFAGGGNDYYDHFTMPTAGESGGLASGTEAWYSFDWADLHFICLDSEGSDLAAGGAMLTWLANDLAANTRKWVVAFWHHPPYTKGSHDSDDPLDSGGRMRDMRVNALPVLEAGGVDLVLTGHSHSYERSSLLDGHYGLSTTLAPSMVLDGGDGRPDGDGAYVKYGAGAIAHAGAVHAVAGSSSQTSGGTLDHPVMVTSLNLAGSVVVDVRGDTLDARFLGTTAAVLDSFRIVKPGPLSVPGGPAVAGELRLGPGLPNPFARDLRIGYTLARAGRVRLEVHDLAGRRLASLADGWRDAGAHEARWDGRDAGGRVLGPGVFLAVLEAHGRRVSRKISFVR
jgi:hypothetical protein